MRSGNESKAKSADTGAGHQASEVTGARHCAARDESDTCAGGSARSDARGNTSGAATPVIPAARAVGWGAPFILFDPRPFKNLIKKGAAHVNSSFGFSSRPWS
ncbi:MAG: hypothetical protein Q3972_03120 [Corynebacterium sp.]|nr:hypothetical protein [Corynebacterium sp.]